MFAYLVVDLDLDVDLDVDMFKHWVSLRIELIVSVWARYWILYSVLDDATFIMDGLGDVDKYFMLGNVFIGYKYPIGLTVFNDKNILAIP